MKPIRHLLCLAASIASLATASAHITYTNRNFGSFSGSDNRAVVISNQGISGAYGWADATDEDWGDAHKGRFFRFTLLTAATVTIKAEAWDDNGTKLGTLKPAFSLYAGLAHLSPAQPDHDGAPITVAYLDSVAGTQEGALRTLANWDIGNDDATTPYDFAAQLTHFTYLGHAADGTATNFGASAGVLGDGAQDGVVEKSFDLPAGDYSIFVGGADYALVDTATYGAKVTVSVGPDPASDVTPIDEPSESGVPYKWTVELGQQDQAELVTHVGAWSWEDNALFDAANGEPPVGWTHTSAWTGITLKQPSELTVHMARQAGVPWPSVDNPTRTASVASMFPSFTIWQHWDQDGDQNHIYNNRGNVDWAEDLVFIGFVDNSTEPSIQRSFNLPAGKYTIVFGSNAPATDTDRQGFKATLSTEPSLVADSYFTRNAIRPLSVPAAKGVLANDLGLSVPPDSAQLAAAATLGDVALSADGAFTYTPGAYFGITGRDTFSYCVLLGGDVAAAAPVQHATVSTFHAASGCYAGHVRDAATSALAGLLQIKVTRTGAWTASLTYGGKKHALLGRVAVDGKLLVREMRGMNLALRLHTPATGARHAALTLSGDAGRFTASAPQSPFSPDAPPPFLGDHLVDLTVADATPGAPQSAGRALLRIHRGGGARIVGLLGDGTIFSSGTALLAGDGPGPVLPIFDAIYPRRSGSVSGALEFGAAATSNATGVLTAVKPARTEPVKPGYTIIYDAETTPLP